MILDVMMPKLDGIEVLKRVRAVDSDVAVIMFTAHPNLDTAVASMKLDAVDYIKKPFNVDEFREVLARVMKRKGLARTPEEQLHRIIGDTIRTMRKERELTLKQMSRRTGLSISLLSQIERAESSPSISSLYKIAVALDSKIHDSVRETTRRRPRRIRSRRGTGLAASPSAKRAHAGDAASWTVGACGEGRRGRTLHTYAVRADRTSIRLASRPRCP
jgi:DNA-binding response OmpR family regulator